MYSVEKQELEKGHPIVKTQSWHKLTLVKKARLVTLHILYHLHGLISKRGMRRARGFSLLL